VHLLQIKKKSLPPKVGSCIMTYMVMFVKKKETDGYGFQK